MEKKKMIAYCGIVCTDCDAFMATQQDDDEKRREMAEIASKELGREVKPEETNCDGCLDAEGRHIGYWDTCEIRTCGTERGVQNCAYCTDYSCEKLDKFLERAKKARQILEEIRRSELA